MIDVLVPVLGRPTRAQPLADSLHANTTVPYTLLFLCSPGDTAQYRACLDTGANVLQVEDGPGGQYATKINLGYKVTANPFLLLAADDLEFTPGWDETVLTVARVSGRAVVGTNDMANAHVMRGDFSTHPLVTREYIRDVGGSLDGPGVVYHEGYDHNYVDRELCALAQHRNEWAFALDAHVIHRHPGWQNPKADATYKKGARRFREDHLLFLERSAAWGHVGLGGQELAAARGKARRRR